jgi:acyl carrier protein
MKLSELIEETFNLKEDEQKDDVKLSDLQDWDSMTHMLFISKIEENFGVELTGDEIAEMQTIGEVKKVLTEKEKL